MINGEAVCSFPSKTCPSEWKTYQSLRQWRPKTCGGSQCTGKDECATKQGWSTNPPMCVYESGRNSEGDCTKRNKCEADRVVRVACTK
ncbi:hypothetical protein RUA4292_01914 [Ruegeria atlantica]|uniref:Uncharacterized protein n=1 Tax=Ruegeria atlantica TaxID=81569 RepID=A0A0P1EDC0_9RHOB|nr:hypothetical protein RUA4292_01914 [Ruegeria atlantica]